MDIGVVVLRGLSRADDLRWLDFAVHRALLVFVAILAMHAVLAASAGCAFASDHGLLIMLSFATDLASCIGLCFCRRTARDQKKFILYGLAVSSLAMHLYNLAFVPEFLLVNSSFLGVNPCQSMIGAAMIYGIWNGAVIIGCVVLAFRALFSTACRDQSAPSEEPRHRLNLYSHRIPPLRKSRRHSNSAGACAVGYRHQKECGICLAEMRRRQRVTTLPCFHRFHTACINEWQDQSPSCPACRKNVYGD